MLTLPLSLFLFPAAKWKGAKRDKECHTSSGTEGKDVGPDAQPDCSPFALLWWHKGAVKPVLLGLPWIPQMKGENPQHVQIEPSYVVLIFLIAFSVRSETGGWEYSQSPSAPFWPLSAEMALEADLQPGGIYRSPKALLGWISPGARQQLRNYKDDKVASAPMDYCGNWSHKTITVQLPPTVMCHGISDAQKHSWHNTHSNCNFIDSIRALLIFKTEYRCSQLFRGPSFP